MWTTLVEDEERILRRVGSVTLESTGLIPKKVARRRFRGPRRLPESVAESRAPRGDGRRHTRRGTSGAGTYQWMLGDG